MEPEHFLNHLQHDQIVQAVHKAERNTTGEIRVFVSHGEAADPLAVARQRFEKLKMHRLPQRNGILIFVAPRSQTFAIVGDEGAHDRIGDIAWQALVKGMADQFKNGQFMSAILFGVEQAGELLATHFPTQSPSTSKGDVSHGR